MSQRLTLVPPPVPFQELPKRKREFIEEYVKTGDALKSTLAAGYAEGNSLKQRAVRLKNDLQPYITEKVREMARSNEMAIMGLNALSDLVTNGESETIRLQAAKELIKLTIPEEAKEVTINHKVQNLSDEQIDRRLEALQRELQAKDVTPRQAALTE